MSILSATGHGSPIGPTFTRPFVSTLGELPTKKTEKITVTKMRHKTIFARPFRKLSPGGARFRQSHRSPARGTCQSVPAYPMVAIGAIHQRGYHVSPCLSGVVVSTRRALTGRIIATVRRAKSRDYAPTGNDPALDQTTPAAWRAPFRSDPATWNRVNLAQVDDAAAA